MKFKYSVIGDNTQENREWLEKVGIKHNPFDDKLNSNPHLISNFGMYISIDATTLIELNIMNEAYDDDINCIGNSPLFKAVSAMREDSDYMQWFVCQASLSDCATCKGEFTLSYDKSYQTSQMDGSFWGKATLTELQERFKLK